jgi:ornithine carrier protein
MQTWSELNPDKPRLGFGGMAKKIWRTRGIKGMYAGLGITCLRSGPSSAMIFFIYETLSAKYGHIFG